MPLPSKKAYELVEAPDFEIQRISDVGAWLLEQLPPDISNSLQKSFQLHESREWHSVIQYFKDTSFISRVLMECPATFKMLEVIYTRDNLDSSVVDNYFYNSLSGCALRNRMRAVISWTTKQLRKLINQQRSVRVVNLGSGPGRDTIEILAKNPQWVNVVHVDCIDTDQEALVKGQKLAEERGVAQSFNFINEDFLKIRFKDEVDLGLMIGVLCGLQPCNCITVLKRVKRGFKFKSGGKLVASNVSTMMLEKDSFTSHILKWIIGWELVYKTPINLKGIFESAGWKWQKPFFDNPDRFHIMGIGV